MKCIYWNTKSINNLDRVIDIIKHKLPDLFFLAETDEILLESGKESLNTIGYEYFPNPGCQRVKILKAKSIQLELGLQNRYYTATKVSGIDTFVISVHSPSQGYQHIDSLKKFFRDFRLDIDSVIGDSMDVKVIIIGDFNVNPYEKPLIDFDGFIATNSTKGRNRITNLGDTKSSYYNPTWSLYSRTHFPGTTYYPRPSTSAFDVLEHHFLDQVLVSQRLKQSIVNEQIEVIEETPKFTFLNLVQNKIEGSDHLPLYYEFKIS